MKVFYFDFIIMDYEKKYKEALERARMYRDNAKAVEDYTAVARYENIFHELREKPLTPFQQCLNSILLKVYYASVPGKVNKFILDIIKNRTDELVELAKRQEKTDCQLSESEDERIRKQLLAICDEWIGGGWKARPSGNAVIWLKKMLEKQKENVEKEYVFRPLAGTDITIAAEQAIRRAMEGDHLVLAFNGWYIRVDKYATTEGLVDGYYAFIEKQKEQKKDNPLEDFSKGYNAGYYHGCTDNEQKPVEWSEEDEKMRLEAIRVLVSGCEKYRKESGCLPGWHKVIDWLKSLRPQPHWKPSEEQMDRLFSIVAALRKDYCDDMADFLANLYADLKKLGVKEEPEYYQHFDPDC